MRRLAIALLLCCGTVAAQTPPCADQNTITVTGTGTARAVPDRVSFTAGVTTSAASVREAFRLNNEKTNRVVKALKDHGVKDTEIQTSNFTIDSPYDVKLQAKNPKMYMVANSVTVTREDPKSVSDLIEAAVDAGANSANNLSFFNSNPGAARDRAIDLAMRDARAQAEKIVSALSRALGPALAISTLPLPSYASAGVQEAITVAANGPAIEMGTNNVSYSVTITYALK